MPTPCNNGLETPVLEIDLCNGKRTSANCVVDETLYSELGLESNSTQKQINQAQYLASINQKVRVDNIDDRVTLLEVTRFIQLGEFTVATLPTPISTAYATVTDAVAPTYLGALTGGGSVVCPVFFNGTIWVSH